jgi:fatty-acyl-CoA synthase
MAQGQTHPSGMAVSDLREPSPYLHLVKDALERWSSRPAFIDSFGELTYGQTRQRIGQVMSALAARGIGRGDRVGVLAGNRADAWIVMVATQFLGGVSVGFHAKASADDHLAIADAARLAAFVAENQFGATGSRIATALPATQVFALGPGPDVGPDLLGEAEALPPAALDPNIAANGDLAELIYTGGTTGRSKGVMQSHRSRAAISLTSQLAYELPVHPRFLASAPITHATGHWVVPTLIRGGVVVLMDGFDPELFVTNVNTHQLSLTFLVPSMIYKLLDHAPSDEWLQMPSLSRVIYGASPMSTERLIEAHHRMGRVFTQIFGQTESLALGTALLSDEHDLDDEARLRSCGRQIPGTRVELLDEEDQPVPRGEVGEMCIKAPSVMEGYLDDPELTRETLAGGWLHTGDMARADDDGYITIVDRRKDFVITGGFNVYSREVEDALLTHPAVAAAAVIGVPDDTWGEAVAALIVPTEGVIPDPDDIKAAVRDAKGPVHTPKIVEFVDELPLTAVGKVNKPELRKRFWAGATREVH